VLGLALGMVLLCGAVWFVLLPILKPRVASSVAAGDAGVDPDDDLSPRAVALRALAEIEFDRATGKLSPDDYDSLKARYTRDAVAALRAGDAVPPPSAPRALPVQPAPTPVIPIATKHAGPAPLVCPQHGVRAEAGAMFCSECGRRLGLQDGDRVCTRCGTVLEPDARFCGRCGGRVAA